MRWNVLGLAGAELFSSQCAVFCICAEHRGDDMEMFLLLLRRSNKDRAKAFSASQAARGAGGVGRAGQDIPAEHRDVP